MIGFAKGRARCDRGFVPRQLPRQVPVASARSVPFLLEVAPRYRPPARSLSAHSFLLDMISTQNSSSCRQKQATLSSRSLPLLLSPETNNTLSRAAHEIVRPQPNLRRPLHRAASLFDHSDYLPRNCDNKETKTP